ncbi:PWWP domain-containing protein YLR455W [Camellia lanceoleosa]|uniref:PWWP domain-containing protein YLR455W n=1 Tax=Camellia lanceoleosa TaxID=1840588 RepID=A0ACC0GN46_9ERIC|nr:PWWP domain-containing protein YLR455W [Camellia lanceoleosa]
MVWGKVKSHPWWPGQIFDEALASPSICRREKEGQVLVAFYGDDTYGWFEPGRLIPFDFHYTEKSKQTNTPEFLTAVGEAVAEVKRRAALGLTCHCQKLNIFRPKSVEGFFEVDVSGFQPGGLYSMKQIERARDAFQPSEALSFVKQLALMPQDDVQRNVEWTNNVALVLAYRRAVFEEFEETYAQAFGVQLVRPGVSAVGLHNPEKAPLQAPLSGQPMISESLGKRKAFEDRVKVKDQQKRKKSLSRQSNDQKTSKDTDGNVRNGKEVITTDKHPILAQREGPTGLFVETPHIEKVKDQPSALKPLTKPFRPDDPAKAGSKSQSSCKQEEKSMKRPKKYRKLSSLAAEKKEGSQKHLKIQGDEKMVGSSVSTKPEILEGPFEPAMLKTKFPLHSKLPSVPELKAKLNALWKSF